MTSHPFLKDRFHPATSDLSRPSGTWLQPLEERGREDGHDEEDWLRAKEEITNKKCRTATA